MGIVGGLAAGLDIGTERNAGTSAPASEVQMPQLRMCSAAAAAGAVAPIPVVDKGIGNEDSGGHQEGDGDGDGDTPSPSQLGLDPSGVGTAVVDDDAAFEGIPATEALPEAKEAEVVDVPEDGAPGEPVHSPTLEQDLPETMIFGHEDHEDPVQSEEAEGTGVRVAVTATAAGRRAKRRRASEEDAVGNGDEEGAAAPVENGSRAARRARKPQEPARAPFSQPAVEPNSGANGSSRPASRWPRRGAPEAHAPPTGDEVAAVDEKPKKRQFRKRDEGAKGPDKPFTAGVTKQGPSGRKAASVPKEVSNMQGAPKAATTTKPSKTAPKPSSAARRDVHVALSGLHRDEQAALSELAGKLEVKCTAGSHTWQAGVTHIVAPEVKRNQKCLAALAEGAWLVGPSFLEASAEAGHLVNEVGSLLLS